MGTNYYLAARAPCECCGRPFDTIHIGKSSAGWCFALHVVPENGINDLEDWRRLWSKDGAVISDEYGRTLTPAEMELVITKRTFPRPKLRPYGYVNQAEFHEANGSVDGPFGLVRHRVERNCVGHGTGTWDLITGEFS